MLQAPEKENEGAREKYDAIGFVFGREARLERSPCCYPHCEKAEVDLEPASAVDDVSAGTIYGSVPESTYFEHTLLEGPPRAWQLDLVGE